MKYVFIYWLIILTGCGDTVTKKAVYHKKNETRDIQVVEKVYNDSIFYIYKWNASQRKSTDTYLDTLLTISKPINNSGELLYFNHHSRFVDTKIYEIDNKSYSISKFDFDIENMYDEESYLYYLDEYGLLLLKNYAWDSFFEIKYDSISEELSSMIIRDTTGFFAYPPPPHFFSR